MHRLWYSVLALWLTVAAMPAPAQDKAPVAAADQTAIRQVIQRQLDAFRKNDGTAAFAFATPQLRERFGSVANFMSMVRDGYQPVYRPSQVSFGKLEKTDDSIVQHVLLVAPDGAVHEALYFMERQERRLADRRLSVADDRA